MRTLTSRLGLLGQQAAPFVDEQAQFKLAATPGVESYNAVGGMSMLSGTYTPNTASFFIRLKPWEERKITYTVHYSW